MVFPVCCCLRGFVGLAFRLCLPGGCGGIVARVGMGEMLEDMCCFFFLLAVMVCPRAVRCLCPKAVPLFVPEGGPLCFCPKAVRLVRVSLKVHNTRRVARNLQKPIPPAPGALPPRYAPWPALSSGSVNVLPSSLPLNDTRSPSAISHAGTDWPGVLWVDIDSGRRS